MKARKKVLFVCIHNSARSQMAEALLNHLHGDQFQAESAGLEPGALNPLAVEAMADIGIDIAMKGTRDVFEVWKSGARFDYVITVCDEAAAERCPIFPGVTKRLHWSFQDPGMFTGTPEEKRSMTHLVREHIKHTIDEWVGQLREGSSPQS